MKVIALGSVLAKRFGVQAAEGLVPSHPTIGDVDSQGGPRELPGRQAGPQGEDAGPTKLIVRPRVVVYVTREHPATGADELLVFDVRGRPNSQPSCPAAESSPARPSRKRWCVKLHEETGLDVRVVRELGGRAARTARAAPCPSRDPLRPGDAVASAARTNGSTTSRSTGSRPEPRSVATGFRCKRTPRSGGTEVTSSATSCASASSPMSLA